MLTGLIYNKGYDPLEKGKATQSRILAWGIPWAEEPGYSSRGLNGTQLNKWLLLNYDESYT